MRPEPRPSCPPTWPRRNASSASRESATRSANGSYGASVSRPSCSLAARISDDGGCEVAGRVRLRHRHREAAAVDVVELDVDDPEADPFGHPLDLCQPVELQVLVADRVVGVRSSIVGM